MKRRLLETCILLSIINSLEVFAQDYKFDSNFIESSSEIDMDFFNKNKYPSGRYLLRIYVNGELTTTDYVFIDTIEDNTCFKYDKLQELGIQYEKTSECINQRKIKINFDFYTKELFLFVPANMLTKGNKEIAPVNTWDDGVNALFLSYDVGGSQYSFGSDRIDYKYAYMTPKLNIGPWRLKNQLFWQKTETEGGLWKKNYLFAETGVNSIKSRFFIGEGYFPINYFDSFKFRGFALKTDNSMLPYSDREFVPLIRGIARNISRVEIYQDNVMIYNTTVPPGVFEINDYSLSGSNSELFVKVIDEAGIIQSYYVPFTLPPIAVKSGYTYYEISGGREAQSDQLFLQSSIIQGIPFDLTIFGGSEISNIYKSISLGYGWMMNQFGAISVKTTYSSTNMKNQENGKNRSYELKYNKNINDIGLYSSLSISRYGGEGYTSLREAVENISNYYHVKRKQRLSISMAKSLEQVGTVGVGVTKDNYWNERGLYDYHINYSTPLLNNRLILNTGFTRRKYISSINDNIETIFNIGVGFSFDAFSMSNSVSQSSMFLGKNNTLHNVSVSGVTEDNKKHWGISQTNNAKQNTTSLYGSYNSKYNRLKGALYYGNKSGSSNFSVDGGILLYKNGLILGRSSDETLAIIETPGVSDVKTKGMGDVETNSYGYAFTGFLTPYIKNRITVDSLSLPDNASIDVTTETITPTKGAIVPIKYKTKKGKKIILNILQSNGQPVPFGAIASVKDSDVITGIVGDNGVLYLNGIAKNNGNVHISWGRDKAKGCVAKYQVINNSNISGIYKAMVSKCF